MISDDQLIAFHGVWAGSERLFPTVWTTAGVAEGVIELRPGPGGGLLLDYEEQRDGAILTGHGVVADSSWWWFDSYGFLPTAPGTARWERGHLILERSSERGRTVTTLALASDGTLEQRIDSAAPADAELMPLMRGTYRRRPQSSGESG